MTTEKPMTATRAYASYIRPSLNAKQADRRVDLQPPGRRDHRDDHRRLNAPRRAERTTRDMATATRPRIACVHESPACYVELVDAAGARVVRPLWITNLDVVELIRDERSVPGDRLAFFHADGCHTP